MSEIFTNIKDHVTIAPNPWPGTDNQCWVTSQPGDFAPLKAMQPILDAPRFAATGGVTYFAANSATKASLESLWRLLSVGHDETQYSAFLDNADDPENENFLVQLRIVSRFALRHMFRILSDEDYESFPEQPLNIGELVWQFILDQQRIWSPEEPERWSRRLEGLAGGNADDAREVLGFGFLVESSYNSVYRVWSRAWLLCK